MFGPVRLDDRAEQVALLIGLVVEEHTAALGRELFDVPVGRLHVGVTRQRPEPGYGRVVGFVPEHGRLLTQPRELLMGDPPHPLVLADEVDVHHCRLSLGRGCSAGVGMGGRDPGDRLPPSGARNPIRAASWR